MAKFRTRARALDMLGRQQIAGMPTAISELFKNAHDAYADRVEVDFLRRKDLLVLRDDGLGMTREEFEKRWLTIGTESKLRTKGLPPPPFDPDKPSRPMLGEKGIGRLAIASIGPQVLVLTRAKRKEGPDKLIACFINWGIFEAPGIDLDDIEIPIAEFDGGTLPDKNDIASMVRDFGGNLERMGEDLPVDLVERIGAELEQFAVDPRQLDEWFGAPMLRGEGRGTHFVLAPVSPLLADDIDQTSGNKASPLTKALLGFVNTMTPDHAPPVINPAFRDWTTNEVGEDIIAAGEFFLPEEFKNADHHFRGGFDEYGQFKGTVSIYGEETTDYIVPWSGGQGMPAKCGAFTLQMANVMGRQRDTTLPAEEWVRLTDKMDRIGGLYIYRDGVRILPYGNTDFDWLDIEANRTKSAGYYHFSHRRMFGVVEITGTANSQLTEKAGREGFRENEAYRQFKSILKNFLERVVADFIREGGRYAERLDERRTELNKISKALEARAKSVAGKREKFAQQLATFFEQYDAGCPEQDTMELAERMDRAVTQAAGETDTTKAAAHIVELERQFRRELEALQQAYRISKPRIGLGKRLTKEWEDYNLAWQKLEDTIFAPARRLLEDTVGIRAREARLELDRRIRIEAALSELRNNADQAAKLERRQTAEVIDKVGSEVRRATAESFAHVGEVLAEVQSDFESWENVRELPDDEVVAKRTALEERIIAVRDEEVEFLRYLRDQMESVDTSREEGSTGKMDVVEALEQRAVQLEEQAETDLQLTQLGMAIEVIHHEFDANIRSIRSSLRRLKAWADVNPELDGLYNNVRTSFDHLDGYLTLFTPMQRRLRRKEIEISGKEIAEFLHGLFDERFQRHGIEFGVTDAFSRKTVLGYPSSFYPVFVNLVDNAAFWVKDRSKRRIVLDADERSFIVCDTGPGIAERDSELIFEFGFSRKPNGRGMGLHISREVLRKVGCELVAEPGVLGTGAKFRIIMEQDIEEAEA